MACGELVTVEDLAVARDARLRGRLHEAEVGHVHHDPSPKLGRQPDDLGGRVQVGEVVRGEEEHPGRVVQTELVQHLVAGHVALNDRGSMNARELGQIGGRGRTLHDDDRAAGIPLAELTDVLGREPPGPRENDVPAYPPKPQPTASEDPDHGLHDRRRRDDRRGEVGAPQEDPGRPRAPDRRADVEAAQHEQAQSVVGVLHQPQIREVPLGRTDARGEADHGGPVHRQEGDDTRHLAREEEPRAGGQRGCVVHGSETSRGPGRSGRRGRLDGLSARGRQRGRSERR